MSYDLYLFRTKDGIDPEEAVEYFRNEEEPEEKGTEDEAPFDPDLDTMELTRLMARPYLKALIAPEDRSRELQEFLDSDEDYSEEELFGIDEINDHFGEWMDIGIDGVWMLGFAYGADFAVLSK